MTDLRCYSRADEGVWINTIARLSNPLKVVLQIADVKSVTLRVFKRAGTDTDDQEILTLPIAVSDCIFDTLQTDGWWDQTLASGAGYNFRHTLKIGDEASGLGNVALPGGVTYELEYEVVMYTYGPMFVRHTHETDPIYSR